jgi:hypothetical protein
MTSSSLTFKSDSNTNLYDELNNTYQITCPFQLVGGEEREFNYTDKCYKASVLDEWNILESEEMVTEGKDFSEKGKCGPCRNYCSSRYNMLYHKEKLQLCHWEEVPLVVNVNGEVVFIIETTGLLVFGRILIFFFKLR